MVLLYSASQYSVIFILSSSLHIGKLFFGLSASATENGATHYGRHRITAGKKMSVCTVLCPVDLEQEKRHWIGQCSTIIISKV